MKRRPGYVSPLGVVVAAVLVAGALGWTAAAGGGLFSPGDLNAQSTSTRVGGAETHADLAGDCGACHPSPWDQETMSDRCLDCHDDVAGEVESRESLHGRLAGAERTEGDPLDCRACHPEHNGPQGPLTSMDPDAFPHDATGFSLRTHRRTQDGGRFACDDCHAEGYPPFEAAICTDCHLEVDRDFTTRHATTYGEDCLACHDGTGRDGAGFDHVATGFDLNGKHVAVACVECHAGAATRRDLEQTSRTCYGCHRQDDEHEGAYGRQCGGCHSTADWEDVTFDHAVFPLDHGSDERTPTCTTCHPSATSAYTCYGCHAHTPANVLAEHEGRTLASLKDCVRCHAGGEEHGEGEGDD